MIEFEKEAKIGELYGPAMEITDESEAREYFEALVQHGMSFGQSREEAESIQKQNLGYYAGYYDNETRERVERLFCCAHPIFGSIASKGSPTPAEALNLGHEIGLASKITPQAASESSR